ncbi:hypothetical protein M8J75_002231 [Diaphorina citri]|nr:hypothetical protein M8J75_002231 [Diaphorina citri]
MSDQSNLVTNGEKTAVQISKIKLKEGTSLYEGKIILFYHVEFNSSKKKTKQLKAKDAGVLGKILVKEGDVVQPGEGLYTYKSGCSHSTVMNDLCAECGFDLQKEDKRCSTEASIPMVHSIPSLKVSEEQAQILGRADETRLIKDRKLVLLVDLDQTLIHTTNDNIPPNIKDIHHFQLNGARSPWYHTRLRPGTHQFLASISQWFELHICTFGSRNYAHQIAHFLDRQRKYFSHRILSRDECFDAHSKTANLKALFPCGDNMVCIIDDREDVWNYALNLIHVKPYHFFRHTGDINAPPGLRKEDNDDSEGYTCAQLAKGVSIKQANTKSSQSSKDRKGKEKNENPDRDDKENRNETEEKTDETESETLAETTSLLSKTEPNTTIDNDPLSDDKAQVQPSVDKPQVVEPSVSKPKVEKELEVLEERISKKSREIVSIVKIVRSNSTEETIPVIELDEGSSNSSKHSDLEYVPSATSQQDDIKYIPSSTLTSKDELAYVPTSTKDESTEYVPTVTSQQDDIVYIPSSTLTSKDELTYVPSSTKHESTEYVPTVTKMDVEYVPTSTKKAEMELKYVPSSTEYVPESTKKEEMELKYVPSSTEYVPESTQKDEMKLKYVPSSTEYVPESTRKDEMELKYVPSSTEYVPSSTIGNVLSSTKKDEDLDYVPSSTSGKVLSSTNKDGLEYVPTSTNKSEKMEYVPTSTEYVPSSSKKEDELEYVPSSTKSDSKLDYVPSSTKKDDENLEYVPSSTKKDDENLEYVPSSTKKVDLEYYVPSSTIKDDKLVYIPSSTNKVDEVELKYVPSSKTEELKYVPSSTNKGDSLEYVPSESSAKTAESSEDVYVPSKTSLLEEYVPPVPSGKCLEDTPQYTPTKTEELEYTPKPMDVEYVPPGIRDSIGYVPTSITEDNPDIEMGENTSDNSTSSTKSQNDPNNRSSNKRTKNSNTDGNAKNDKLTNGKHTYGTYNSTDTANGESTKNGAAKSGKTKGSAKDGTKNGGTKAKSAKNGSASEEITKNDNAVSENTELDKKESQDDLIEVEEVDDYLLYLEEILKHIHEKFYTSLDQMKDGVLPDLKCIIPAMRSTVLSACHLVFSGVVPSKMRLEDNKAYSVARSLGAEVSDQIVTATTHLVAVRTGTAKVNEAKRRKNIRIVTLDWLWMCAERWERVDERLFPVLSHHSSASRTPPAHCASPPYPSPPSPSPQFCDSINPLMTLTSEDIANMDREVEDIFNETDDDDDTNDSKDQTNLTTSTAKRKRTDSNASSSSSVESLSGDRKSCNILEKSKQSKRRKKRKRSCLGTEETRTSIRPEEEEENSENPRGTLNPVAEDQNPNSDDNSSVDTNSSDAPSSDNDGESLNSKFRRCAPLPSDVEFDSSQSGDEGGDEWNLMGAALEREFA